MVQVFLAIAAVMGGSSVAAGAFGSHALREQLSDRALAIFETGVRYQMYHALVLLAVGLWLRGLATVPLPLAIAGWSFVAGVVLFSGSLYGLSLSGIKILGAVAPLGGACLLLGWGCLAIAAVKAL